MYIQRFPGKHLQDALRVWIVVQEIDKQNLDPREPHHIVKKPGMIDQFQFFAPNEMFEQITHNWEEHDSMPGRFAQLVTDTKRAAADVQSTGQSIAGGSLGAGDTESARFKMDTPLVWSGSQRREMTIPIIMLDQDNPSEINDVARKFKMYSSAKIDDPGATAGILFPYIFELRIGSIIAIPDAACTAVQTTFHHPYIGGLPTHIEMSLTFLDLRPLYEHSFTGGATVTTNVR